MLAPDHDQTPRPRSNILPRRKGPPSSLRIDTPAQNPTVILAVGDSSASTSSLSSANSDSDFLPPFAKSNKPKSMRNTKKLSLTLPSAHSNVSATSLTLFSDTESHHTVDDPAPPPSAVEPSRKASIPSLANFYINTRRKGEDEPSGSPYAAGPVEILPGIWLGSEDNALDWKGLAKKNIRAILNVAKEVNLPSDSDRQASCMQVNGETGEVYYPAASGRSPMHYLKLNWSHGQQELVKDGFITAMAFIDSAASRGDGVLIHCQCGVSRSATVVIALVMRAAALSLPAMPSEVMALKGTGFSGAYDFVKSKSECIGPNMHLIYQLQDYQQALSGKTGTSSSRSSVVGDDEEEWSRRRRMLDSEETESGQDSAELREAHALDKAMEERVITRKASGSSTSSCSRLGSQRSSKARYSSRKRAGSITSNISFFSENLIEEGEEEELLGVGGGFDAPSISTRSPSEETTEEEINSSPELTKDRLPVLTPLTARPFLPTRHRSLNDLDNMHLQVPPSAPASKTSFGFNGRLSFRTKMKSRPPPLNLPPVPASPDVAAPPEAPPPKLDVPLRRKAPPPLELGRQPFQKRSSSLSSNLSQLSHSSLSTPSQTLFVFPASPTLQAFTPHMVTVLTNASGAQPSPMAPTPRVSSFRADGRRRSFVGFTAPPTPTVACTRVDARGWMGTIPRGS